MKQFNHLNKLINQKEPFMGSVESFMDLVEETPQVSQLVNFIPYSASNWDKLSENQKQKLSQVIDGLDLSEDFNSALGVSTEETFKFKDGHWENEKLDFFKVEIDTETQDQLKSLNTQIEVKLKLNPKKVLCFEMPFNPLTNLLNKTSKKTIQLTLGLALLSFTAININSMTSINDLFNKGSQIVSNVGSSHSAQQGIDELIAQANTELSKSSNPALSSLKSELSNFNLKAFTNPENSSGNAEASEELISELILHFYEQKNPQHIDDIKPQIPKIAKSIIKHSNDKKIDFRILMSILKVESDFKQSKVSHTGDYSLAQINYATWSGELNRVKKIKLNKEKLKVDIDYSIRMMTEILQVLEKRHQKDPVWYARYHSGTPSLKLKYSNKVDMALGSIKLEEYNFNQNKIKQLISKLKQSSDLIQDESLNTEAFTSLVAKLQALEEDFNKSSMEIASR